MRKNKKKKEEEEPCVEERRKKKKKERHFPSRSPTNRRSKLVRVRGKVGLCDKGYVWVPKSKLFVEVPKGKGFSYTGYFLPSGHVGPYVRCKWYTGGRHSFEAVILKEARMWL